MGTMGFEGGSIGGGGHFLNLDRRQIKCASKTLRSVTAPRFLVIVPRRLERTLLVKGKPCDPGSCFSLARSW